MSGRADDGKRRLTPEETMRLVAEVQGMTDDVKKFRRRLNEVGYATAYAELDSAGFRRMAAADAIKSGGGSSVDSKGPTVKISGKFAPDFAEKIHALLEDVDGIEVVRADE